MKPMILRVLAAVAVVAVCSGCANVPYESAMEWMQKQPMRTDP